MPDVTPIGRMLIAALAVFIALTVGGALAANWQTVLLWVNRVPYDPAGAGVVTDPVFGRDISFFLFELPFLRFVQATVIGLIVASFIVAGARYLVGALDRSAIFSTPVRVHLGTLAGLFLMAIAVGYQLDKFELVYSTRGVAEGVSYTDFNAQFLAFDVLTGLSAIAAAFLVGGAFSRVMWPLGLTVAVWFIASIGIGTLYPEAIQRFSVQPNEPALESPFISNNISMTREAFDLDGWEVRDYRGEAPLTEAAIEEHDATFLNARLWDYRPLGDTLDQLQTVRQYYDFTDVDTDRYPFGEAVRQVMLSVRELAREKNPTAVGFVNERIYYTHGIGVAMVPVNEVATQGQPRLVIRDLPPVSSPGAPEITEPRVYFGERPSSWVVVGARQTEFDFPQGQTDVPDAVERHDRHQARHDAVASPVRPSIPRPRSADQRPDHRRQPAPLPSLDSPIGCRGSRRSSSTTRTRTSSSARMAGSRTCRMPTRRPIGSRTPSSSTRTASTAPVRSRPASTRAGSTTCGTASRSSWTPTTGR